MVCLLGFSRRARNLRGGGPIRSDMHHYRSLLRDSLTVVALCRHLRHMRLICAMVVAVAAACSQPNPVVCCSSPADCNSIGASEQTRPCVDGFVCIAHECANAPPADAAPACTIDSDCPTAAPHCANNTCVQCVSSDQCAASAPVCDQATNTCGVCVADMDCASAVCDSSNGTCSDESKIIYASPTGGDASACSHADPCSIAHAIASVDSAHTIVRMLPGNYTTNVTITGKTLWLDGAGATLTAGSSANAMEINNGAHVRITGLDIVNLNVDQITGNAIRCETLSSSDVTPILDLDGVSVDASFVAMLLEPCTVNATRSHFHDRSTGNANIAAIVGANAVGSSVSLDRCVIDGGDGVQALQGSTVSVSNSLVENMTGPDGALIGRELYFGVGSHNPPGTLFASFVTLVNAPLLCGNGTPSCIGGPTSTNVYGACIDNSIITAATGNAVTGTACVLNYSLAFPQSAALTGAHNLTSGDPRFVDPASNFSLSAASPAIDAADPAATDMVDLVGTPRPQGIRDDLGAYEYKP
jgi:hypothetical protein